MGKSAEQKAADRARQAIANGNTNFKSRGAKNKAILQDLLNKQSTEINQHTSSQIAPLASGIDHVRSLCITKSKWRKEFAAMSEEEAIAHWRQHKDAQEKSEKDKEEARSAKAAAKAAAREQRAVKRPAKRARTAEPAPQSAAPEQAPKPEDTAPQTATR